MNMTLGAFFDTVRRSAERFAEITRVAQACEENFGWLSRTGKEPIPFLDADIIIGTLSTLAVHRRIEGAVNPELLQMPLIGPNAIRACLGSLEQFTIPPGAVAEVVARKKHVYGRISSDAERFLRRMAMVKNRKSDITSAETVPNLASVLKRELAEIAQGYDDFSLLESLIDRAYPVQLLVDGTRDSDEVQRSFKQLLGILNQSRPRRTESNLHDAINIAYFVKSFQKGEGMPFFITGTQKILDFESFVRDTIKSERSVSLIRTYMYLMVSEALKSQTFGESSLIAIEANLLHSDAMRMAGLCRELGSLYADKLTPERANDLFDPDYHASKELELLGTRMKAFTRRWHYLFEGQRDYLARDQSDLLNVLFSEDLAKQINSHRKEDIDRGMQGLERQLRDEKGPYYRLWKVIHESTLKCPEPIISLVRDVRYSLVENIGQCLSNAPAPDGAIGEEHGGSVNGLRDLIGGNVRGSEEEYRRVGGILTGPHDLRALAHVPIFTESAVLAMDSWREPRERDRRVGIIWLHNLDVLELWISGVSLLRAAAQISKPSDLYEYMVVLDDEIIRGMLSFDTDLRLETKLRKAAPHIVYFELYFADVAVFSDAKTFQGRERQVGVSIEEKVWTKGFLGSVSRANERTNKCPLHETQFSQILSRLAGMLRLIELA